MQCFWLDSDVFIQARRIYYPFDVFPGFWKFLIQQSDRKIIKSPYEVFRELANFGDELSNWVKVYRDGNLFYDPDECVQEYLREIVDYVNDNYQEAQAREFLDDADPWAIAHAAADNGIVVTLEVPVGPESFKVKIPNICREFNVSCTTTFQMLRELGAEFILKSKGAAPSKGFQDPPS